MLHKWREERGRKRGRKSAKKGAVKGMTMEGKRERGRNGILMILATTPHAITCTDRESLLCWGSTELCRMPLDLVIVMDKSEYWRGEFSQLLQGVSTLVTRLSVGRDMTHVSVVSYSRNATLHFDLVEYFRAQDMQNVIRSIVQDDSGTATHLVRRRSITTDT